MAHGARRRRPRLASSFRTGRCRIRPPTSRWRRRWISTATPITLGKPIGIFENQTDVGAALVPGDASYDAADKSYTITSAGYNIWYTRDEFRYLWKKMSGDVSLAADHQLSRSDRLRRPQGGAGDPPEPR